MSGPELAERALRTRYWDRLRARRRELTARVDLDARRRDRERAWRTWADRRVADSVVNDQIWRALLDLRWGEAGERGYLWYRWAQIGRHSASPEDLNRLHYAIEEWVSPVLLRIHEERRVQQRAKTLRPWDVARVDVLEPEGQPMGLAAEILALSGKRPEVRWMIRSLAALETTDDSSRTQCFEHFLQRWAEAAMIDSFETWSYTHPDRATDPAQCGNRWRAGWLLYLPGVDWTGLEREQACEWHDRWPVFVAPLRAIEPALGQLAAVQLWAARDRDVSAALQSLREALAAPHLHQILHAAGVELALDEHGVREAVEALEGWV
jgi:oligoendopeptidase F